MRHRTISVKVKAYREPDLTDKKENKERIHVASANFVFVTMKNEKYVNHGLSLEN